MGFLNFVSNVLNVADIVTTVYDLYDSGKSQDTSKVPGLVTKPTNGAKKTQLKPTGNLTELVSTESKPINLTKLPARLSPKERISYFRNHGGPGLRV